MREKSSNAHTHIQLHKYVHVFLHCYLPLLISREQYVVHQTIHQQFATIDLVGSLLLLLLHTHTKSNFRRGNETIMEIFCHINFLHICSRRQRNDALLFTDCVHVWVLIVCVCVVLFVLKLVSRAFEYIQFCNFKRSRAKIKKCLQIRQCVIQDRLHCFFFIFPF